MYLNHEKGNTNIDNQFKESKKIEFNIQKKPLIVGIIVFCVVMIVGLIIIFAFDNTKYFITLDGAETIKIYQGSTYQEPGYRGFDNKQNDLTNQITVYNNVNSSVVGTYTITYKLNETVITRTVEVVEKGVGTTYIHLYGDNPVYLNVGQTYQEPGYKVIDSIDSDITHKTIVSSNIDVSKKGVYRIAYTVTNSSGITTSNSRAVIVR